MTQQNLTQLIITIGIIVVVTVLTRALPFILFPTGKKTPQIITYLGTALPYACIAMLVVYCYKGIDVMSVSGWLPELIAGIFVIVIHKWRHNLLLSIAGGTALYMVLVQFIFR